MIRRRCRLRSTTSPGPSAPPPVSVPAPRTWIGNPVLRRVTDDGHDVVLAARHDHAQRIDLVQARVVGVREPIQGLEIEVPVDQSPQIVIDSSAALVHGGGSTSATERLRSMRIAAFDRKHASPPAPVGQASGATRSAGTPRFELAVRPGPFIPPMPPARELLGANPLLPVSLADPQVERAESPLRDSILRPGSGTSTDSRSSRRAPGDTGPSRGAQTPAGRHRSRVGLS